MKKYEIKLKIVTPCIMSGYNQKEAELRAPSIRGQLRHWFRVLGGSRTEETTLFGGIGASDSGAKSKIIVRVKTPTNEIIVSKKDGQKISGNKFDYFLWPLRGTRNNPNAGERGIIEPQLIDISIIDKSNSTSFEKCLKAFLYLGALGSRSRRAYGSIFPEKVSCNGSDWKIPSSTEEFIEEIKQLQLKNITILSIATAKNDWSLAVQACANFLKAFRCGSKKSGTPSTWGLNDHDIVFDNSGTNYRAAIGLPLSQRYSSKGNFQTSIDRSAPVADKGKKAKNDRWASPVFFKVVEFDGKFIPLVLFFKDYFIPEGTKVTVDNRNDRKFCKVSHDILWAMMDPDRHNEVKYSGAKTLI